MKNIIYRSQAKNILVLCITLVIFTFGAIKANAHASDTAYISWMNGAKSPINELGLVNIILKDGRPKKECKIYDLTATLVTYEKEKSLHDLPISNISRMDLLENRNYSLFFDEENKPYVKWNSSEPEPYITSTTLVKQKLPEPETASDLIIMNSGDSIICRITKETSMNIFYTENSVGKMLAKENIRSINREAVRDIENTDLTKENQSQIQVINVKNPDDDNTNDNGGWVDTLDNYDIRLQSMKKNSLVQGNLDGKQYFNGSSAFAGGMISGIFFPFGWLSAIVIAATPPQMLYNSNNPRANRISEDPEYKHAYKRAAHRVKARKALGGFIAGIAVDVLMIMVLAI